MEIRVLKYFLAVAREESILKAAETLHITQPTLSRQLMDLEQELGKKLFTRGSRRITLTEDGILLRRRAEEIIELIGKTENEIRTSDDNLSGDIYIGAGETEVMSCIAKLTKDIQNNYPDIHYHIFSGNEESVSERLDKGLIDFGILIDPKNIAKYEYVRLPQKDKFGVIMRKDSPLAENSALKRKDLWNVPLIMSAQVMDDEKVVEAMLGRKTEQLNITATYNLIYNASLLAEAGLGYVVGLDRLVNTSGGGKLCFKPIEPPFVVQPYVVWKKNHVFSKAAELFMSKLQEEFTE